MYAMELVEGKEQPERLHQAEGDEHGPTFGLMLRLTRHIWYSSQAVILDSGFCVLNALIQLRKRNVFASAIIKKREEWPAYIKGNEIDEHMKVKGV